MSDELYKLGWGLRMIRNRIKKKLKSLNRKKQLAKHLIFIYSLALVIVASAVLHSRARYTNEKGR